MSKVKLEVIGQGPYIKAPDFCPYKEIIPVVEYIPEYYAANGMGWWSPPITRETGGTYTRINPVICAVCKYCEFVPVIGQEGINSEDKPPMWYNKDEMYHWLITHDYSQQIAEELLEVWATHLQGAFNKGWEKAERKYNKLKKAEYLHI